MKALVFLLFLLVGSAQADDEFFGSWHNKKDSFYTLGFCLRKDGKGVLGTGVLPVLVRWKTIDNGILLTLAGDNQPKEMRLTYDANAHTLVYEKPEGGKETFWRISSEEPPDMEAKAKEQQLKEQKLRPKLTEHRETLASIDALLLKIQTWADQQPSNKVFGLTAGIRPSDSSWNFSLRHIGTEYFLEMPLLQKTADTLSPALVYLPAKSKTEPDLPIRYSLPQAKAESFRKWLAEHKIAFTDEILEGKGSSQIEGYLAMLRLKTDRDTLRDIVNYLLNDLFRETKPPFWFSTYERDGA